MKLLRLFLIALLLQPCPVCWAHGVAAIGELGQAESAQESCVASRPACCSPACHLHDLHESTEHDEQHNCPCVCHISEIVFAQTTPAVNLRSMTVTHNMLIVENHLPGRLAVLNTTAIDTSQATITAPLRL
ncbi:hypothetical protein [Gimesia algae]|uniref:Uncharacterized protein n=1 Tax=Gimesia algae TaxID=2527971 RepID=A0A517VL11_9PLAN|nr:hypothetical protein [Gimesia algae]QDT93709.1 hypothetical protein Pan161_53920 [Gimesia algae]